MKIIRGIAPPMSGERVVAVTPPPGPYTTATATLPFIRRRMNLFAHRALTHLALTAEQRSRMADAARLAQAVAPGVVDGLEVALEGEQLIVMPGHAISPGGEDVELAYPLRIAANDIALHPDALAARLLENDDDKPIRERIARGKRITLGEILKGDAPNGIAPARPGLLPHAMVLVAQPLTVAVNDIGELDRPCQNAVDETAYSSLAWEDGAQLWWVPWPADTTLPPWAGEENKLDDKFRNRLAYAIFNAERERLSAEKPRSLSAWLKTQGRPGVAGAAAAAHRTWPWEAVGAPLAVVGFDANFLPAFSDRGAVVRQGGGRRNRSALVRLAGDDVLWQARIAQLIEHLAELPPEQRNANRLANHVDWLPPAGILPKELADFGAGRQFIFPASFDVQAQPVPLDMVDALIAESASLLPFNLSLRDQVQILVPVPARCFEPDLLKLDERMHPLFDAEVARLESERLHLLNGRDGLRLRYDVLARAVSGSTPPYAQDDANALPDEGGAFDAAAFTRVREMTVAANAENWHGFRGAHAPLDLAATDVLFLYVRPGTAPAGLAVRLHLAVPPAKQPTVVTFAWGAGSVTNGAVRIGDVPSAGAWSRLTVPVAAVPALAGARLDGIEFGALAGGTALEMTWGYAGKLSQGLETSWVTDALPHGATAVGAWTWREQGTVHPDAEDRSLGLPVAAGVRHVAEVDNLVESYRSVAGGLVREMGVPWVTRDKDGAEVVQASEQPRTVDRGLDELIGRLQQRMDAANDHVEFGFLRARTDIFRVRQSVLGVEDAGRFLTSPTAAELIKRNDNPVATEEEFAEYFKRARSTAVSGGPAPGAIATPGLLGAMPSLTVDSRTAGIVTPAARRPAPQLEARGDAVMRVDAVRVETSTTETKMTGIREPGIGTGGKLVGSVEANRVITGATTTGGLLGTRTGSTVNEVSGASMIGATLNTVTVGERLTGSAAVVTSNAAAKGKSDFVKSGVGILKSGGLLLDDVPVFGYRDKTKPAAEAGKVSATDIDKDGIEDDDTREIEGTDLHESTYFQRGIDAIDNMVRFLRGLEIRVEDYRRLQADAIAARDRVLDAMRGLLQRLAGVDTRLAEVRHDLSVARSLRAEEELRIAALIARRKSILAEQVPFLVFRRPRLTGTLVDVPVLAAEPAVVADPVPRCRAETHDVPPELQQMVDTLKEVPAYWFQRIPPLIAKFDRIDVLQTLIDTTRERLEKAQPLRKLTAFDHEESKTGKVLKVAFDQQESRVRKSGEAAHQALALVKTDTWKNAVSSMMRVVSIADLVRANPPTREVTLEATGELDDIAGVAACLYAAFSGVPPATRLRWAEIFSELDSAASLRSLTVLPDFGNEAIGVDYIQWRQMQIMVDWLFSRIAPDDDAVAAINDLVRVCLLLASHAPVRRIISARIRRPVPPVIHGKLDLELDPKIARIGMQVLVQSPVTRDVIARAVVEDIAGGGGMARITQVMTANVTLDSTMHVVLQSGPPLSAAATAKADQKSADSAKLDAAKKSAAHQEMNAHKQAAKMMSAKSMKLF